MSVEDKIRRAEEIYVRRKEGTMPKTTTVSINNDNKKELKLLKKMVIQIIISLLIYGVIYIIQNNNYIFSQEFLNKVQEVLSYDINFEDFYKNGKNNINQVIINIKNKAEKNETTENQEKNGIGGAEENVQKEQQSNEENTQENQQNIQENEQTSQAKTQEEQDIENIKNTTTFIKPIEGTISSKYGQREPTTSTVPKNHTGVDIASNLGTKIKSATSGEVVIASEEGDYGKHLKIQIGEVSIIYAHCNSLYVKQGDQVTQGQEIAEVGSTGNSTGPHLHFEIRISERTIDPQKILEL